MGYLKKKWQSLRYSMGGVLHSTGFGALAVEREPSATTGAGTSVGTTTDGRTTLTSWTTGASPIPTRISAAVSSALDGDGSAAMVDGAAFRTATAPVAPSGFSVQGLTAAGVPFNVTVGSDGFINSDGVVGTLSYSTGVAVLRFGTPTADPIGVGVINGAYLGVPGVTNIRLAQVRANSLRYNAVSYSYIPLSSEILGLNPVRLPADGRVPIYRKGSVVVVHHTGVTSPATVSNGQTVNLGRVRLSRVNVLGATGARILTGYSTNLDAGTITFTDVTGYSQPVTIQHRVEDMALVVDVQVNGQLRLGRPLTHNYPLGSKVSSALLLGDLQARVSSLYDQTTWTGVWSSDIIGTPAGGTYDQINYPPQIDNLGGVTERWVLQFTSSNTFNIIGEHFGTIGAGNVTTGCSPLNPSTGTPYFTLSNLGFGAGWATGNCIRIDTVGAIPPVWVARVIQQSSPTTASDSFELSVRGDVDSV